MNFMKSLLEVVSISELARELGIARGNIYHWVKGTRSIPKKHIDKIEEKYGISYLQMDIDIKTEMMNKIKKELELKERELYEKLKKKYGED